MVEVKKEKLRTAMNNFCTQILLLFLGLGCGSLYAQSTYDFHELTESLQPEVVVAEFGSGKNVVLLGLSSGEIRVFDVSGSSPKASGNYKLSDVALLDVAIQDTGIVAVDSNGLVFEGQWSDQLALVDLQNKRKLEKKNCAIASDGTFALEHQNDNRFRFVGLNDISPDHEFEVNCPSPIMKFRMFHGDKHLMTWNRQQVSVFDIESKEIVFGSVVSDSSETIDSRAVQDVSTDKNMFVIGYRNSSNGLSSLVSGDSTISLATENLGRSDAFFAGPFTIAISPCHRWLCINDGAKLLLFECDESRQITFKHRIDFRSDNRVTTIDSSARVFLINSKREFGFIEMESIVGVDENRDRDKKDEKGDRQ